MWQVAAISLLVSLSCMVVLWLISLWRRDASIVDPFWGTGFVVIAWTVRAMSPSTSIRANLICVLVTIWGLRLSLYLLGRNWGHSEDFRYAQMRQHHGRNFWWVSLLTVFGLQGVLLWLISLPIQVSALAVTNAPWNVLDGIGFLLWCTGFLFESVGDWQLARFKSDPANAGKVMQQGLWRYTRHPNYFGDFCIWWGIYLVAVSNGAGWTIISPLLMSWLLIRVSGVTLLESTITQRRPEYESYRKKTSPFIPWFPGRELIDESQ